MAGDTALDLSRRLLALAGLQVTIHHQERVPTTGSLVVISNHRSLLDVPLLMTALDHPVRFACHHFMGHVPGIKQVVNALGCFPLDPPGKRPQAFFQQATRFLQAGESVGLFPEGAQPMIQPVPSQKIGPFQRGFAHLALQAPVEQLAILPIAIAATRETITPVAPFKLFQWLAPSEPLFNRSGWHPAVYYHQVHLRIGQPLWITDDQRKQYRGKSSGILAKTITQACHTEISELLAMGNH
ncbi:lysophospholipid acyltransferase family protein [Leptothoe spongobia]|uniref:1-acyl-sn-glycerol-3-phosphate acyltransferase n=1 Tax=Leptothoe spongobia TAU-MAC 1115 TaxID=1967444 RepID=A0A947GKL9_9CYAN|nr:lysophospholipid acyltransferase family protein [Leptothoe spongobia]MBT9317574.1 1-acyl-sn-glycerol-3-phosphate acyltransferase [Leptothoe spongobia TAU-MAC 1115]